MEESIFKNGSTTYYWSAKFFPKAIRADVLKLYSFVRVADNFVDNLPQDEKSFYALKAAWMHQKPSNDDVIKQVVQNMHELQNQHEIPDDWVRAFLASMEEDLNPPKVRTMAGSLQYVYGSAEVIGLMMAKILDLSEDAYQTAKMQGRAMQWINFIRDIDEDNSLGRMYFPQSELKKFGLQNHSHDEAQKHPDNFADFVRFQIDRYHDWQQNAEAGYSFLPWRYRVPIKTASDMYTWTAHKIWQDPQVIFSKKVKPSKNRVVTSAVRNAI